MKSKLSSQVKERQHWQRYCGQDTARYCCWLSEILNNQGCFWNLGNNGISTTNLNWFSRRISEPSTVLHPKLTFLVSLCTWDLAFSHRTTHPRSVFHASWAIFGGFQPPRNAAAPLQRDTAHAPVQQRFQRFYRLDTWWYRGNSDSELVQPFFQTCDYHRV